MEFEHCSVALLGISMRPKCALLRRGSMSGPKPEPPT